MKNRHLRRTAALLALVVALAAALVLVSRKAAPSVDGPEPSSIGASAAPSTVTKTDCDTAALSHAAPDGFVERISDAACLRYVQPETLEGKPGIVSGFGRLEADDPDSYVSVTIADAEPDQDGCRLTSYAYGLRCLTPAEIRSEYARVDGALTEAYLGPEVHVRCDVGTDCVVREADAFTSSGRWVVLTADVAEREYDGGFDAALLDIIRSIDAQ